MAFFNRRALGLWLAVLALMVDQATKLWALEALLAENMDVIPGFFGLTLSFNRGVAFSFLADSPHVHLPYLLAVFAFAVSVVFVLYMPKGGRLFQAGLGCIVGGALGNMVDRFMFGGVIDFIWFYYGDWSFPIFNVADIAINIGVGFILIDAFLQFRQEKFKFKTEKREQT